MLRITFGLCLVIQSLLVSGNQLTLIPLQTCPHTCSQNAYHAPVNIPVSRQQPNLMQQTPTFVIQQPTNNQPYLLQQPMNNNQPYYIPQTTNNNQLALNQQSANNNQVYSQPVTLQNELAARNNQPIQNNQAMNPLANQLNQLYMNKLISNPAVQTLLDPAANKFMANPTIQTIVDPNTTLYSPKRTEIPRQAEIQNPRSANQIPNHFPNADNVPHIINNYYVLPPEYFEKEAVKGTKHENPHKRERDGHRRPTHDHQRRRHNQDSAESVPEVRRKPSNNHRRETHRRSEVTHGTEQRYSEEERDGHKKRRQPNGKHYFPEMDRERHVPGEHHSKGKSEKYNEKHHGAIERTHETPRPHKQEIHRPSIIIKIKERPKQTSSENIMLKIDSSERSVEKFEQIPLRSSLSRNSKDEAIIQEFSNKFPAIPEEVVRKLLSYLRRQLRKQQIGHPVQYHPNANFPLRYEQLFPNFNLHEQYDHWRRPNRRQKVKKMKSNGILGATDVESTTNYESITTGPTATEIAKTINPVEVATEILKPMKSKERYQETISKTTHRPNSEPDIEIPETTTTYSKVPELGTEDTVLDVNNGIIEDYYPDFTNEKTYFESEEIYNVRNLRDNRYYYTTDRNYESRKSPFINSRKTNKPKYIHTILGDSTEDVIRKPIETETESTTVKHNTEEELEFRTPPTLDSPDFITKQIVKETPGKEIHKHLSYKSSTYSDAKNPTSKDVKNHKMTNKSRKIKPDNIETVYAHSKVIKYGKMNEESGENVTPVVTYYLPDNMQYQEDGKTVVIAKSIPADHFW